MNWKTRQMFSDREHGIVSGLSPVNMTGGGNVPYAEVIRMEEQFLQLPKTYLLKKKKHFLNKLT